MIKISSFSSLLFVVLLKSVSGEENVTECQSLRTNQQNLEEKVEILEEKVSKLTQLLDENVQNFTNIKQFQRGSCKIIIIQSMPLKPSPCRNRKMTE